ncbi:BamA/TamA family outer membrane protein [Sorangium sp. So ce119]|uniref:BamA/TamA family outer membrane protein n=1 Tax=Sorangium sp. So ce119 TaxID=3133279 RepID=UPI003F63A6DD
MLAASFALPPGQARAQESAPAAAPPADEARGWEKPPPAYEPEDVGLFVPRGLLFVPRMALKVLFWPIQSGLRLIERHHVIEHAEDVLYNDERTGGVVPVISYQTDLGPSFGFKAFHDDVGGHDESVSFDARFGGRYVQAYQLVFDAEHVLGSRFWIESLVRFEIQPRLLFQGFGDAPGASDGSGLGPRDAAVETRFRQTRMLALARFGYAIGRPGGLTKLGVTGILNHRLFSDARAGELESGEHGIGEVYDTSRIPGFDGGTRTVELDANVIVDTRDQEGATGSGVYLELLGGGVVPQSLARFAHVGAELTGYIDLFGRTRVLVLRGVHEAVAGDDDEIPFAELPRLGGPSRLRGYSLDRFRDRTAAVATAEYHYPIHEYVAGSLFIDAGRVAPTYASLFSLEDFRLGGGGGFIVRSKTDVLFTLDIAYGDGVNVYFTTDPLRAFARRGEQL